MVRQRKFPVPQFLVSALTFMLIGHAPLVSISLRLTQAFTPKHKVDNIILEANDDIFDKTKGAWWYSTDPSRVTVDRYGNTKRIYPGPATICAQQSVTDTKLITCKEFN